MADMTMREVYEFVGREYPGELYGDISSPTTSVTGSWTYAQDHRYTSPPGDASKPITDIYGVYAFLGMTPPVGVYETPPPRTDYTFSNVYDQVKITGTGAGKGGGDKKTTPLPDNIFGIQLKWIMLGLAALIVIAAVK